MSKIDDIREHMNNEKTLMKTISIKEAAKVANSEERNIQIQMCDSGWFEKTNEKGVYRLLSKQKQKAPKQQMNDGIKDIDKKYRGIGNSKETSELEFVDKENSIATTEKLEKFVDKVIKQSKDEPKKLVKKTTFHCPHCNLEVLKD